MSYDTINRQTPKNGLDVYYNPLLPALAAEVISTWVQPYNTSSISNATSSTKMQIVIATGEANNFY